MSYSHLTIDERSRIEYNLRNGVSISMIAKVSGRNKSIISRELGRNKEKEGKNALEQEMSINHYGITLQKSRI